MSSWTINKIPLFVVAFFSWSGADLMMPGVARRRSCLCFDLLFGPFDFLARGDGLFPFMGPSWDMIDYLSKRGEALIYRDFECGFVS